MMKRIFIIILSIILLMGALCLTLNILYTSSNSLLRIIHNEIDPEINHGFKTKEEVIQAVRENVKDLNELVDEITKRQIATFSVIEKPNTKKIFKHSVELDIKNIDKIFEILKINYIAIREKDKKIKFYVNFYTFSNYCGFYYSYDNNAIYDNKDWKDEYPFIRKDDWTLLFFPRYGWYTEKICDKWFYYENYEGPREVIEYIEDDLKDLGYYERIMEEISESEKRRYGKTQ